MDFSKNKNKKKTWDSIEKYFCGVGSFMMQAVPNAKGTKAS